MPFDQAGPVLRYLREVLRDGEAEGDPQLLRRFTRDHDEAAFAELLRRHGPLVWGVCRRLLGNSPDAEDAFQATFLVLVRRADSLRDPERLGCWLYGVARKVAARARAVARRSVEPLLVEPPGQSENDPLLSRELAAVLDEEVARLPEKFRLPVVLCYLMGMTNEEAARQLGCPKGTVISRLATARGQLRARLLRRGLALSAAGVVAVLTSPLLSAKPPASVLVSTLNPAAPRISAAALAQGVLTTMTLNRMFIAGGVLLGAVLLTAGLGLITSRPALMPEVAASESGRSVEAEGERPGRVEPDEKTLAEARQRIDTLRILLDRQETQWAEEKTKLRQELAEVEEAIRSLERQPALKLEQFRVDRQRAEILEKALLEQKAGLRVKLNTLKSNLHSEEFKKEAAPIHKQLELIDKEMEDLKQLSKEPNPLKDEEERTPRLVEFRKRQIAIEEQLHLLDRRQAASRGRLEGGLEAEEARLRQLTGQPVQSPEADLHKKLDRMLKELGELRQELKKPPR